MNSDASRPPTQVDLLNAFDRALSLTCAFDLHFCDRGDPKLSKTAEKLQNEIRQRRSWWPIEFPEERAGQPLLKALRHELLSNLRELATAAGSIGTCVSNRPARDRTRDEPGSAGRCKTALCKLWQQLEALCQERYETENLTRETNDPRLSEVLEAVRAALPTDVVTGPEPTCFMRELRRPGETHMAHGACQRLAARIARTWKPSVGHRAADGEVPEALEHYARDHGLDWTEAKESLIEESFAAALKPLYRRLEIRAGQRWRKRVHVPVRTTTDGSNDVTPTKDWAEGAGTSATPRRASFWAEELPSYRAWKWMVNAAIRCAEEELLSRYGDQEFNIFEDNGALPESGEPSLWGTTFSQAAEAFEVNGEAEVEARLGALEYIQRFASAGLTERQAEVWLRTAEHLPPGLRQELAASLNIEVPDYRQTRQEAADDLGISPGTVGSHRHRGRKKLQTAFVQI